MQTKALQRDRGNAVILATACMAITFWAAGCGGGGSTAVVPVSTAGFSVSTTSVSFGSQAVGTTSAPQTAILINVGTATLTFSSIQVTGPNAGDYTLTNTCGTSLAPQAQCSVSLTFTPSAAGTRTASVVFTDNAAGSPQTVNVTGMGTSAGVGLSASTLTFGSQLINTSTPAQTVTLTNNGNSTLTTAITVGGANAGDFSEGDNCGGSVAAQASCTISVAFKPTVASPENALLTITDNAPGSPQTVTLTGTGTSPTATPSPSSLPFGNQTLGTPSAPLSVTLSNTGNASLNIASIAVTGANPGDFSATNTCGVSVAAGSSCTISVTFTPASSGSRSASVAITDNAPNSPQMIPLTGTGTGTAPVAGLSTNSLIFGIQSVGTTSGALTAILSNTGNVTLTAAIAVTGTNAVDFVESDNCGGTVAAGTSCTISVVFKPTLSTTENAALTITDNAANSPQTVSLSGTGTASAVSLSTSTLTFASQTVGTTSAVQAVNVTNTGTGVLTINSLALTGANAGDYAQNNSCGSSVAAGGSCGINVTFTPTAPGTRAASVTLTDNATGSPQTVSLSGTGSAPAANLNSTSLTFSSQTLGTSSAVQSVTLSNTGNAALSISNIAITGTNAGDYSQTNTCGSTVAAGGNCNISVTFTPTAPGSRTASVTITDNSAGSPQTVSLTGTGTGPVVSLSASTLTFASQAVGSTSGSQTLNLNNTGNGVLTITGIQTAGTNAGDFSETNTCGSSVVAGGSCTISVTFAPTAPGTRTASLTLTDNATSNPQVSLSGTGNAPLAGVTTTSLTFSNQNIGTTSGAQTVTLNNTGNATLSISSIAFTGSNTGDFAQTTTCGSSLSANGSCTIGVTFTPKASGNRTASLTITDNTNNVASSQQSVTLTGTGTGPSANLSPPTLTFGSQTDGTTSAAQSISLTNLGSANLIIASISLTGTDASNFAQTNTCGSIVVVNATCTINVTFTPSAASTRTASLSITDNAGGSPQTVPLTGTGLSGQISLSPSSLTFTIQNVGTTGTAQSFTMTNTGNASFNITSISIGGSNPGDFSESNSCGSSLPQNASCTIVVKFSPTAPGTRTATVSIADSLASSPQTVALTGTGSGPAVSLSTGTLTFTNQNLGTTSAAQSLTLTNTGNATLTITSIGTTGTDPGDFALTNTCGGSVAVNGNCTISVQFAPAGIGNRTASVSIADNAGGSPQTVNLTGTGSGPIAGITTNSLTFNSQNLGTTSAAQTFTLNNTGNVALSISSIAFTGANPGDFGDTTTCGSSLAANGSCTISVTFTPAATGTRTATLSITDNSNNVAGSQQSVSLTGTGTGPVVGFSPGSLTFSGQTLGSSSAVQAVSLSNTGSATLNITNLAVTGANAGDFSQTNTCGASVTAGGNCTISVTFTPTALGNRSASISLTDNAAGSPQSVALSGTGNAPVISLSAANLTFGNQTVQTPSAAQTVTLSNTSSVSLTVTSISVTGANSGDFSQNNTCGTSVAANGSCMISVTFTPAAIGSRTAAVSITDNAAGSPQTVSLTGTGTGPAVSLNPNSLTFTSQNLGTTSAAQTVTLNNTGNATLNISNLVVSGTNSGDFTQTNTCGSPVSAGSSCTISVTFTPTAPGSRSASVTITDNASSSPQTVNLTGTGSAPLAGVTPPSLTFNSQNVDTTSVGQMVTLNNTGNASLTIASITLTGANSAEYAQTNTCGGSVGANSSCTVSVTFTPAAPGTRTATLTITDNSNNVAGSAQSVSLTGTGNGAGVGLSPSSLSFGSQSVGVPTPSQSITLTNTGNANLTFTSISVTGTNNTDFSQTNTCTSPLAAGGNCTISVTFTPSLASAENAAVSITDNAGGSPQSVGLTGSGLSGQVSLSPSSLTFTSQNVGTTSSAQTITLSNTGNTSFTVNSIGITGTNQGDFSMTNTCGASLAQGANCTISVKFAPTAPLIRTASVSIADSLAGSPQTASLTGTGSAPLAGVTAASLTFTSQNLGTTSTAQTFTLNNTGNVVLTLNSIAFSGANSGDFGQTNTCGGSVAASGSCTISVTFAPSAIGTRTATLNITDNSNNVAGSQQSVGLTGTGSAPVAGVTTPTLTFSSQTLNTTSTAQTFMLNNTGNATLSISSIGFTGANPGDFGQNNTCGSSVAASGNCTITVTFTPTATGSRAASLNITDNSNNVAGSQQSVGLTGTGTSPIVSLSASTLSFSPQTQGTSSVVQSVTLTNTGNANLTITSISVTGANPSDFSQTNTCVSPVAANGTCTINVTFTPTGILSRAASINIADNAPGAPQSITLTGTGNASIATLSAVTLNFGNQAVLTTSPSQAFTLTNTGNVSLTISLISVTGANAGDYLETNTCPLSPSSLAAGSFCTFTVTFTPSASGNRSASVSITDNATAGSPQAVTLGGTGAVGTVGLSATVLTFGSQSVGTSSTPAQVVTLTNGGSSSLTINGIQITGTNPGDFALSNNTCTSASPLGVNGTCTVSVTFAPTTAGSRAATLTFTDSATNSPQTVNLTGTGTAPEATLPSTLTFGSTLQPVPVLTPYTGGPQPVTLQNTGNAIMNIASPAISGANAADFSIATTTCGTTLAAGSSCQIMIAYTPSAYPSGGTSLASLTFTDNNNNVANSTQTVSLTGSAAHDIVLSWTASPTAGVTYNVYRGTSSGNENTATPLTCITTTLNTASTPSCADADPTLVSGTPYFYVVTAVVSNGSAKTQSANSNEASAVAK